MWTNDCQVAFESVKKDFANIVELKHFDVHKDNRIVCDASHNGLGASFEQLGAEGWRLISFASRFLNAAEKKYSTNKLEMLAVVWGSEYFRNYIFGRNFTVVTDHKALVSLLNGNKKKNKTMFSHLTRWIDRLILFDSVIEHMPGAKIGLADYLSRHPVGEATRVILYDNTFTVANLSQSPIHLVIISEIPPKGLSRHHGNWLFQLNIYNLETPVLIFRRKRSSKRVTFG